jgi:hypothetical protein
MNDSSNTGNIFFSVNGGLTPPSFFVLLAMPLLLSGRFKYGAGVLLVAFVLAINAAMVNIKEEDKQEIRCSILDPEDIIAELETLEEELADSSSSSEIRESGRTKCLASLSALVKKYRKKDNAKNLPLLCQQAAFLMLRLYPESYEAVGSAIALLALVAKDNGVRQRNKYQADIYGFNWPIRALRSILDRAKKEEDEDVEGGMAEILRKGCLLLGALSDDDKELDIATTIVEEEGLELILDIANWFRFHEEVANWAMWALFILCYDHVQNKIHFIRLAGINTVCALLEHNPTSLEVNRHGIAILFDLLREGNVDKEGKYDPWKVRTQALAAGLHQNIVRAMSEFSDSMDIMMMGQEMLLGTGFGGDIPQFQQM